MPQRGDGAIWISSLEYDNYIGKIWILNNECWENRMGKMRRRYPERYVLVLIPPVDVLYFCLLPKPAIFCTDFMAQGSIFLSSSFISPKGLKSFWPVGAAGTPSFGAARYSAFCILYSACPRSQYPNTQRPKYLNTYPKTYPPLGIISTTKIRSGYLCSNRSRQILRTFIKPTNPNDSDPLLDIDFSLSSGPIIKEVCLAWKNPTIHQ